MIGLYRVFSTLNFGNIPIPIEKPSATAYTLTTMPAEDITLYAKWTINQYTISFDSNGVSIVTAVTQDYETTVLEPVEPTKEGYTFGGWYSDSSFTTAYAFTTMPAENITI